MTQRTSPRRSKRRGAALVTTFAVLALMAVAGVSYVDVATQSMRISHRQTHEVQTTHLCEAGIQTVLRALWRPFKVAQNFFDMEDACTGASPSNPRAIQTGTIDGLGAFSAGVISFTRPPANEYVRIVVVRAVAWLDYDQDGTLDAGEPSKVVDVSARFELARSQVFDYTYFVNNYGWMEGFNENALIVNGDMRSNGNFDFLNGSPTVNGTVIAAMNEKLIGRGEGLINMAPVKWSDSRYVTEWQNTSTPFRERWRQPYNASRFGAKGSTFFEQWRDFVYSSTGELIGDRFFGATMQDATGSRAWTRTTASQTPTYTMLDTSPSQEVIMPDLSDIGLPSDPPNPNGSRMARSKAYRDTKQFFGDGTLNPNWVGNPGSQNEFLPNGQPNPNYAGAFVDVWDPNLNGGAGGYRRVSSNGVIASSAVLVGSSTYPIRIHGPVAVLQDVVIKGFVQGQGTLYAGRNVHVVGSVQYKSGPDFRGTNPQTIENTNEKRDFLGLAARRSIILGNPLTFTNTTLRYMRPPFTKPRYDENGLLIPAYDATQRDETGRMLYMSVIPDSVMNSIASGVNVIDAILYTNFVGGGNVGTGGGGMTLNGTLISKDEAIVTWSLPVRLNYDNRIREKAITRQPLIDLDLPRSPTLLRSTWQDRGMNYGGN